MPDQHFQEIEIKKLHLDLANPRFGLFDANDPDEALRLLVNGANVKELWASIASTRFERYEPLIAIAHPTTAGEYIVIEGNRRLAACKTLLEPERLGPGSAKRVPTISEDVRASIATLPVVVVESRSEASAYIGFKHVNGPSTWSSLAKARFGVRMLEDADDGRPRVERMKELTQKLGDSRGMLLRVFVAYKIYQQAVEQGIAEAATFDGPKIEFSHLYTMLNHGPTREFLGLPAGPLSEDSVVDSPISENHLGRLKELFGWLFGEESVIRRQGEDRPTLQKVIASAEGLEALRSTGDLAYAATVAGLDAEDWNNSLSKCAHFARKIDSDAIEIAPRMLPEDIGNARTRIRQTQAYLKSVDQKLSDILGANK